MSQKKTRKTRKRTLQQQSLDSIGTQLPPIRESHDGNFNPFLQRENYNATYIQKLRREDSAPRILSHVNRRRRMYAKAMNIVEDERLVNAHHRLDLAQSLMEQQVDKQSEKLRRLLEDIDRQQRDRPLLLPPPEPTCRKKTPRMQPRPSLASTSCPAFAFSTYAPEEPLGRWVRYPKVLRSLKEAPLEHGGQNVIREDDECEVREDDDPMVLKEASPENGRQNVVREEDVCEARKDE